MEVNNNDILDLVQTTVIDLGVKTCVRLDGDNILIGNAPVSIASILACKNSAKAFVNLIRGAVL